MGHLQVVPGLLDQLYRNAWGVPGEGRDHIILYYTPSIDGFGGLAVSMLASGTPSSRVQTRPKSLESSGI